MNILAIKTDVPLAELHLIRGKTELTCLKWQAHRELSATIHLQIQQLLKEQKLTMNDIKGIIFFTGPGSFTGLRIGASVANSLAASLQIPIVGSNQDDWLAEGQVRLDGASLKLTGFIEPFYGSEAIITKQK